MINIFKKIYCKILFKTRVKPVLTNWVTFIGNMKQMNLDTDIIDKLAEERPEIAKYILGKITNGKDYDKVIKFLKYYDDFGSANMNLLK